MSENEKSDTGSLKEPYENVCTALHKIQEIPEDEISFKNLKEQIAVINNFKKYTDLLMNDYNFSKKKNFDKIGDKYISGMNNYLKEIDLYYKGSNPKLVIGIKKHAHKIDEEWLPKIRDEFIPFMDKQFLSEKMITGVDLLDSRHKSLFIFMEKYVANIINDSSDEDFERTLRFLEKYVKLHFDEEESIMEKSGYHGTEKHKAEHKKFSRFVDSLGSLRLRDNTDGIDDILTKVYEGLNQWFVNHIMKSDMKFIDFYKDKI